VFAPKKLLRENQGTVARAKNIPTALHKRSSLLGTSTVARLTPPVEGNVAIFDHVSVNWSEKRAGIKKKTAYCNCLLMVNTNKTQKYITRIGQYTGTSNADENVMKKEIKVARVVDSLYTWQCALSYRQDYTWEKGSTKIAIPAAGGRMDGTRRHGCWEEGKVHRLHHLPARPPSGHPGGTGRTLVVGRQEAG
jgi:hypothetical protein